MKYLLMLLPMICAAKSSRHDKPLSFKASSLITDEEIRKVRAHATQTLTLENIHDEELRLTDLKMAVVHITLGEWCSTVSLETQAPLEQWHKCAEVR